MGIYNLTQYEASLYSILFLAESGFLLRDIAVDKSGNIFRKVSDNLLISEGMLTRDGHDLFDELTKKIRDISDEQG